MNGLGPAPAPRLEPLRPGDRDPSRQGPPNQNRRNDRSKNPKPGDVQDVAFENDDAKHELDERA
jgi:hypothetical protein